VHEGVEPGAGLADDRATEGGYVVGPASPAETSVVVAGRHQLVRGNADGRAIREDMGVEVDKAWRDELASGGDTFRPLSAGISASSASITPKRIPMSRLA